MTESTKATSNDKMDTGLKLNFKLIICQNFERLQSSKRISAVSSRVKTDGFDITNSKQIHKIIIKPTLAHLHTL